MENHMNAGYYHGNCKYFTVTTVYENSNISVLFQCNNCEIWDTSHTLKCSCGLQVSGIQSGVYNCYYTEKCMFKYESVFRLNRWLCVES
jgi:hypothetical protein